MEKALSTPPSCAPEREVLFDDRGAERDARDRYADAHRVVGQPHLAAEQRRARCGIVRMLVFSGVAG